MLLPSGPKVGLAVAAVAAVEAEADDVGVAARVRAAATLSVR